MTCQPGCMVFDGGERKHHRDCEHYPESLTKLWHDTEAEYVAEIERLRGLLGRYADHVGREEGVDFLDGILSESPITDQEANEIMAYMIAGNPALAD